LRATKCNSAFTLGATGGIILAPELLLEKNHVAFIICYGVCPRTLEAHVVFALTGTANNTGLVEAWHVPTEHEGHLAHIVPSTWA
jgi:hypothetical protein